MDGDPSQEDRIRLIGRLFFISFNSTGINRVTHVHIKDVDAAVLAKLVNGEFETMHQAVEDHYLFAPAGEGVLDLAGFIAELEKIGFGDWMMSEQDKAREPAEEKSGVSMRNIKVALGKGDK